MYVVYMINHVTYYLWKHWISYVFVIKTNKTEKIKTTINLHIKMEQIEKDKHSFYRNIHKHM